MQDTKGEALQVLLQVAGGKPDLQSNEVSRYSGTLLQLAAQHKVSGLLLKYVRSHPGVFTGAQVGQLANRCRQNAVRSLIQLHELVRVASGLQKYGITAVAIKGPQLSRMLYGMEALKESVDLDIMLVREADTDKASSLLRDLGYAQTNLDLHPGRFSRKIFLTGKRELDFLNPGNGCRIDLHLRPGANAYLTARFFRDFFKGLGSYELEGIAVPVLPPEKYLVYLCYHGALHRFSSLGWLVDIRAFLTAAETKPDLSEALRIARSMHAERSLFLAFCLLETCFGETVPSSIEREMPRTWRMRFLVNRCLSMLSRDPGYGITLSGRSGKLLYMMVFIRGIGGRIDLLYGIVMRAVAGWLQRKNPVQ